MLAHATMNILLASALALHVAIAAILVRQYLRTRDPGLVWLGVAVVIWPLISSLLDAGERVSIDRAIHRQAVIYPFTLIVSGQMTTGSLVMSLAVVQQLIGIFLLLVAVLYLCRTKNNPIRPVA
jgi:hypothetical protein